MVCNRVKMVLMISLLFPIGTVRGQSIGQLIEQLTMDIQKLSELKTILQDMYTGYEVVEKGYTGIRDIVRDNFHLHKTFLDGLLAVSSPVRQYYRVAGILDMEGRMIGEYQAAERQWAASGVFTTSELQYIHGLYAALSTRAGKYLDRLSMVLTDEELRMSDAERIAAVDAIYMDASGDLAGFRSYNDQLSIQALQRGKELQNINLLKNMYGEHP